MSVTEEAEKILAGQTLEGKIDRLVEDARQMHEHQQVDKWTLGDDAVDVIRAAAEAGDVSKDAHIVARETTIQTGHLRVLDGLADRLKKEAPSVTIPIVRKCFDVSRAWPVEERLTDKASWSAHRMFSASRFHGKRGNMIRRVLRESTSDYVTMEMARLKASESLPRPPVRTPLERTEDALASTLRRVWNPVDRVGPDDRKGVALIMRKMAHDFESGDFS